MDQPTQLGDKILIAVCVTIIALSCVGLAGYAMYLFKDEAPVAITALQVIFGVVLAGVSGLLGMVAGQAIERLKHVKIDDHPQG